MDGTLTLPVHDFEDIRRQLGIDGGVPILEAIDAMTEEDAVETKIRLNEIEMEIATLGQPQPGAAGLLEYMKSRGFELGILTRNDEEIAIATLEASGLGEFFDRETIIGRETCAPKPLPDGVLHLLSHWQSQPNATVMVGDYLYDIEAGKRAGVNTVHFDSSGRFSWPHYTDHKVSRLADIVKLID
nr:uncharacterized protein LOC133597262 [Nerophis lumbriciformis]